MSRIVHTYLVSADHVVPKYAFQDTQVRVVEDGEHGFYATHALGCSKHYATAEQAAKAMFYDNACTNVRATRTLIDPDVAAKAKGWEVVERTEVKGDGIQAPGFVVMSTTGEVPFAYAVHFFNAQDGGFHSGDYCKDLTEASASYRDKVARWTRHH